MGELGFEVKGLGPYRWVAYNGFYQVARGSAKTTLGMVAAIVWHQWRLRHGWSCRHVIARAYAAGQDTAP